MKQVEPLHISTVELSGVTLIEASAGTGKTYTLSALFVRLLLERQLSVDQILVVTYTRAATAELRVRIRKRISQTLSALSQEPPADDAVLVELCARAQARGEVNRMCGQLSQALLEFDRAAIFTIHGFCQRVLQRYAFESGAAFDAELSEDQSLLLEEVVSDFWANRLAVADEVFAAALSKHRLDIPTLLRFVQRALPNPDLRVWPPAAASDRAALTEAHRVSLERVARLWQSDRETLIHMLLDSGLNARLFGERNVHGTYVPFLDELSARNTGAFASVQPPDWLARLTPEGLVAHCNKGKRAPQHAFFTAVGQLLSTAEPLTQAVRGEVHSFLHELLRYARRELDERAEARGLLGFEDLLKRLHDALRGERGPRLVEVVRGTYQAALIDEFQDTDPLQLDVFKRIYAPVQPRDNPRATGATGATLFLIGDPKQAIYAFRGADIFAYLAASEHTTERVRTLTVNYRSDPPLLSAIERIFSRARLPFVYEDISFRSVGSRPGARAALRGPALEFLFVARPDAEQAKAIAKGDAQAMLPARVAAEIAQLLRESDKASGEPILPGEIAVLCRTNAQAAAMQGALRELGVPAVLDGDASVFDSAMAEELGRWLWAMVEPADSARIRASLASPGIGFSAEALLALEQDEASWDAWVARFHDYQSKWQSRGFLRALYALCDELGVAQRLLSLPDGERRYTDLWHLAELLHQEEQRTRKGPRALLDFYRRVREGSAQREGMALEDVQVRLESDAHAVILTTVHKSKGLEYPIVYCPYLWSSSSLSQSDKLMPLYHDRDAGDQPTLLLPGASSDEASAAAAREALAEGTRLLYVALTRAKHRVSIVWGALSGVDSSALAYVLHQPELAQDSADPDAVLRALKDLPKRPDSALLSVLTQLQAGAPDAICVRPLRQADGAPRYRREQASDALLLDTKKARFPAYPPTRVGSFSSLIERERWTPHTEPEPLDRDALSEGELAGEGEGATALPKVTLADFPAGASFGHLVHSIYENADFEAPDVEALRPVVAQSLLEYGADADWEQPLSAAIYDSLQVSLAAAGGGLPSLSVVPCQRRRSELEFVFPVAEAAASGEAALAPQDLGQLLGAHARDASERAYAQQLGRLRFSPLRGFLRGFIDLTLEHAGRFYVIDYKSNRLGPTAADYQPPRLLAEMRRHHYVLQYLLYCVAVHRYLGLRLASYSYDDHFGGVYYLFVRGMGRANPPGSGVLFERPPRALIEALSARLADPQVSV